MASLELAQQLQAKFSDVLTGPAEFRGEATLKLADAARIAEVCEFAKKSLSYDLLLDISSLDNYGEDPRWTVVYELYGTGHHCHLRLKTNVSEEKSELPTVTGVWKTADWHEREAYDMFGIQFAGHPDLRRILMWDTYPYHPLRKEFPLAGVEVPFPAADVAEVTGQAVEPCVRHFNDQFIGAFAQRVGAVDAERPCPHHPERFVVEPSLTDHP